MNYPIVVTEEEVAEMKTKYDEIQALIAEEDQILHDYMTHVKVFNKCFVTDDSPHSNSSDFVAGQQKKLKPDRKFPNKQKQIYSNVRHLESLLYPWLTQRSPIFEPVNGKRYTLFKSLYPFLNGRGIVLTMADSHVDSAVRLFHLLRSLDTKLPIQIIYQPDNLSDDSKFQLIQATTSKFFDYSTLDLTFVNVKPAIDKEYRDKFSGFGNKILAVLFNSFEEMIFLDADAVVTKSPEEFFRLKKYVRSGTLFYKDRATVEYRPESDITFFKKLMNTQMDEIFFGMDQVTNKTMQLPFFSQRMSHFMESGLVLIDRRRHFQQPLIMSLMNFYETVKSRIYGDKELFWLSLALSGDESFEFNKHFAAAIGEITPLKERLKDIGKTQTILSREICSNHPAHISDEDNRTLLWFNSGYQFCNQLENIDFGREASDKKRYSKFKSTKQFEKFFRSQLSVKAAIIPPSKKLEADNNLGEPSRAWVNMRQYCDGYTWCGYSSIGAGTSEDEQGTVIEFTALETNKYEKLGKIWMNDFDYQQCGNGYIEVKSVADTLIACRFCSNMRIKH
ncbi:mannosyltransferase putative-domain-containing protein [Scheffersomyces xylosifermentans]|uniref:mannosyltransferase putative-domain-containing protein n=1 Tax=Scheffersomyces xylosifermentans TaxID=1304137 RepID=UPI00315DDC92